MVATNGKTNNPMSRTLKKLREIYESRKRAREPAEHVRDFKVILVLKDLDQAWYFSGKIWYFEICLN